MTREEAIKIFREWTDEGFSYDGGYAVEELDDDGKEALEMAIKALSQEPKTQMVDKSNFDIEQYKMDLQSAYDCGFEAGKKAEQEPTDAVSREAVREILTKYRLGESRIAEELNELPPVTQKSGKWTLMYEPKNMAVCSECGKCAYMYRNKTSAFCPNCGARMESEE